MYPGIEVGAPVVLHLFEERYKILIRRAWEGNKQFIYTAHAPARGVPGVVVVVAHAEFLPDGRANISGTATRGVVLGVTFVEEDTSGLHHTRLSDGDGDGGTDTNDAAGVAAAAAATSSGGGRRVEMPAHMQTTLLRRRLSSSEHSSLGWTLQGGDSSSRGTAGTRGCSLM